MTAVLMYGPTEKDADLFHVIPTVIVDPFPYLEDGNGRRAAVMWPADAVHLPEHGVEVLAREAYGWDDLVKTCRDEYEMWAKVVTRACADLGIADAAVPPQFPVFLADALRVDPDLFVARRRVKTAHQLDGIRRAQATADAAMAVARDLTAECRAVESVRAAIQAVYDERGCEFDDAMIAPGAQSASYHEMGEGPLTPGEPVVVDLWPRDRRSRCWADMTRTFVAGGTEPPAQLAEMWRLCRESLDASYALIRPGGGRRRGLRRVVRAVRGGRLADAAHQGARRGDGRRLRARTGARRRPGRPRAPEPRPSRRRTRRGRRHRHRACPLPPGLRRLPTRGPRPRHRGQLRAPHRLPVRTRLGTRSWLGALLRPHAPTAECSSSTGLSHKSSTNAVRCRSPQHPAAERAKADRGPAFSDVEGVLSATLLVVSPTPRTYATAPNERSTAFARPRGRPFSLVPSREAAAILSPLPPGDADGVYSPGEFNDRLLLGLQGTMSEAELQLIRARLDGGLRNNARRGELRLALPVASIATSRRPAWRGNVEGTSRFAGNRG